MYTVCLQCNVQCNLTMFHCCAGRNLCQDNNGGCSQLCFPTSESTRSCSCAMGYNLHSDRMSCEGTIPASHRSTLNREHSIWKPWCESDLTCTADPIVALKYGVVYDMKVRITFYMYSRCHIVDWFGFVFELEGIGSFLMYSVHEGIRGISLDPSDNSEVLMPVTGSMMAVGIDFHAGECIGIVFLWLFELFFMLRIAN